MKVKLYSDAYSRSIRKHYKGMPPQYAAPPSAHEYWGAIQKMQGESLDIETRYLFADQYNAACGQRIFDYQIESIDYEGNSGLEERHNVMRGERGLLPFAEQRAKDTRREEKRAMYRARREQEKQRKRDMRAISDWLLANVSTVTSRQKASAWASLITRAKDYDRNAPITDNRINGIEFDIPAPCSL